MRHNRPAQILGSDPPRYRYVTDGDNGGYAIGYCADDCEGHATEEQACEHYRQYLLDTQLRINKTSWRPCKHEPCEKRPTHHIQVGMHGLLDFCEEHATREMAEKYFPKVSLSWES